MDLSTPQEELCVYERHHAHSILRDLIAEKRSTLYVSVADGGSLRGFLCGLEKLSLVQLVIVSLNFQKAEVRRAFPKRMAAQLAFNVEVMREKLAPLAVGIEHRIWTGEAPFHGLIYDDTCFEYEWVVRRGVPSVDTPMRMHTRGSLQFKRCEDAFANARRAPKNALPKWVGL